MPTLPARRVRAAHWRRLELIRRRSIRQLEALARAQGVANLDEVRVAQYVLAMQRATVTATAGGFNAMLRSAGISGAVPLALRADALIGQSARNGAPLERVYSRVPERARAQGPDAAMLLLRQSVNVDSQLAQRRAAHAITSADRRITRWRRQVNPGGGETCGLCLAASTQTYSKQNLLPIHPMCRCTVYPVVEALPGQEAIDREVLAAVYDRSAGATDASNLGRVRINADELPDGIDAATLEDLMPRIEWHDEMGPLLTGRNHRSSFSTTGGTP